MQCSILLLPGSRFIVLKAMDQYEMVEENLRKNKYISFNLFEACFLIFSSNRKS